MSVVPKRFIIAYLLAFALLYGGGVFLEGRFVGAHWARLPFEPIRRTSYSPPGVHVYVLTSRDGISTDFVVVNEARPTLDPHPEADPDTEARLAGKVLLYISWYYFDVLGPFVSRERTQIRGIYEIWDGKTIASEDLDAAQDLAFREVRATFRVPPFARSDVEFWDASASTYERPLPTVVPGNPTARVPWWALITLFAFAPTLTAWVVTVATMREKSGAQ